MMKRAVAILLAISLLGITPVFAQASLQADEKAGLLKALGIVTAEQDPLELVRRGEFAAMIYRMANQSVQPSAALEGAGYFTDVTEDSAYYQEIAFAVSAGYMSGHGDGTFRPNEYLLSKQAVTVAVKLLGYQKEAEARGGYPLGYLMVAKSIPVSGGSELLPDQGMYRKDMFSLLYSVLHAKVMTLSSARSGGQVYRVDGETYLYQRFGIYRVTELVNDNGISSLYGESTLRRGMTRIGAQSLEDPGRLSLSLLGYRVSAYIAEETNGQPERVVYLAPKAGGTDEVSIAAGDITGLSDDRTRLGYLDGSERTARLSPTVRLVYNGKVKPVFEPGDLMPRAGGVRLTDNDSDDVYDMVFVTDYQTMVISSVSESTGRISGKYAGDMPASLTLDPDEKEHEIMIERNGERIGLGDLRQWDVLHVAASEDGARRLFRVVVSSAKVAGTLEQISVDSREAVIDGKTYPLSLAYADNYQITGSGVAQLKVGTSYTCYLNPDGEIVAGERADGRNDMAYGYLAEIMQASGLQGEVAVRIFGADNEWHTYPVKSRVRLRDEVLDAAVLYSRLTDAAGDTRRQLVQYRVDEDGLVTQVKTAVQGGTYDEFNRTEVVHHAYWPDIYSMEGHHFFRSNTAFFYIPTDADAEGDYKVESRASLREWTYIDYTAYGYDEYDYTDAVVINQTSGDNSSLLSGSLFVVTGVSHALDSEGMHCYRITGGINGQPAMTVSGAEPEIFSDVAPGDILVLQVNRTGRATAYRKVAGIREDIPSGVVLIDNLRSCEIRKGEVTHLDFQNKRLKLNLALPTVRFDVGSQTVIRYHLGSNTISTARLEDIEPGQTLLLRYYEFRVKEIIIIEP